KMPAFEWVHVQLHQQKGMISLSPPTICNSANLWHCWHGRSALMNPLMIFTKIIRGFISALPECVWQRSVQ
ncbi:hypothetical protein M2W08_26570, partial [Klebsiella pneumoniae]|nr:hypothetical protein [Klebsiella pneumoniae]